MAESLGAKLEAKRAEDLKQEAERVAKVKRNQESLAVKLAQQKTEQELAVLRGNIASLQEKRRLIVEAQSFLNGGAEVVASGKKSLREGKEAVKNSAKSLATQKENLENLIAKYPDVFQAENISTAAELAASPKYPATENIEVADYKGAEKGLDDAQKETTSKRTLLKETARGLKGKRRQIKETLPELDIKVYLSEPKRSEIAKKLELAITNLDSEIETLTIQTPEGQQEAKDKLRSGYLARFKDRKFLEPNMNWRNHDIDFVRADDVTLANKYDTELVIGAIREGAELKLTSEVLAEKQKIGVLALKDDLQQINKLPQQYEALGQEVYKLEKKRRDFLNSFYTYLSKDEKLLKSLNTRDNAGPQAVSEQWLQKLEKVLFEAQNRLQSYHSSSWDKRNAIDVFKNTLQKGKEYIDELRNTREKPFNQPEVLDPVSFGKYLERYSSFLDGCQQLINNEKSNSIKQAWTSPDYNITSHPKIYLGFEVEPEGSLNAGLKLSSEILQEINFRPSGENYYRVSLRGIEDKIIKKENPVDERASHVKEYLKNKIESEWANEELNNFRRENPKAIEFTEKAKKIEKAQHAAGRMLELLPQSKLVLEGLNLESKAYLDQFILSRGGKNFFWNNTFMKGLEQKVTTAEQALTEASKLLQEKKEEKRPKLFGREDYDNDLKDLQQAEREKLSILNEAKEQKGNASQFQLYLENSLQPLLDVLNEGALGDIKPDKITEVLETAEVVAKKALTESLSPDELAIIEKYNSFSKKYTDATEKAKIARGKI